MTISAGVTPIGDDALEGCSVDGRRSSGATPIRHRFEEFATHIDVGGLPDGVSWCASRGTFKVRTSKAKTAIDLPKEFRVSTKVTDVEGTVEEIVRRRAAAVKLLEEGVID